MNTYTPQEIQELKAERKEIRSEMKLRGIKKTSCFNGGLDSETYRLNARLFELNTKLGAGN
jgi:hypothetical protein